MPVALIFLFGLVLTVALVPAVGTKITAAVEDISSALTSGPINAVTGGWEKILVITVLAGGVIWYAETKIAKREGLRQPDLPNLVPGTPAAPSFSGGSGYGVNAGPLQFQSSTGAASGGGTPSAPIMSGGGGGYSGAGRPGYRERRAQRQEAIERSKTKVAQARRDRTAAKVGERNLRNSGFSGGSDEGDYRRRRAA